MAKTDILVTHPIERLANALDRQAPAVGEQSWPIPLAPASVPAASAGAETVAEASPATHHVLVALSEPSRKISLSASHVASERHAHIRYYVTPAVLAPAGVTQLDAIGGASPPMAILLDIAVLDKPNAEDTLHHLRCRLPGTRLLLGWSGTDATLDAALLAMFDGCLPWSQFESLGRALDAMLAGELWFSRAVMQAMYRHALGTVRGPQGTANADMTNETGAPLTRRESDVFVLMRHGLTNIQIANQLNISVNTVKKHLCRVFEKRGLRSRQQAID